MHRATSSARAHRAATSTTSTATTGQARRTVRRLDTRQRLAFSLGSPVRATAGLATAAAITWLGAISIGVAAVIADVIVMALFWGLPFGWAGRLRLVLDKDGITDISRFRRVHHRWGNGALATVKLGHHSTIVLGSPDDEDPVLLSAGWCPDQRSADAVLAVLADQGWPVARSA